jgi:Maltogenic Amylase, C-terminal domain
MIAYYRELADLRSDNPALSNGSFATLVGGDTTASHDDDTYAFARSLGTDTAVIALNKASHQNTASIAVDSHLAGTQLTDALSGATAVVVNGRIKLTLAPRTGVLLLPF